jgi:hypothetical protein
MRFVTKVMAAIVVLPAVLPQTPATALPCDNTRWCESMRLVWAAQIAASSPLSSAGKP